MDKGDRNPMIPVREDPGPVKIGTLCSDCTNPEEKVMQSYVFDLGNIIRLGMYEKARISAEVLCEQGRDPAEVAEETVFPAAREALAQHEKGIVNKAHAVKSLEAASVALAVLEREMPDFASVLQPGAAVVSPEERESWEKKLLEASLKCCGFLPGEPETAGTIFVEIAPDSLPEAMEWIRARKAESGGQQFIAFGKPMKIAQISKIDVDLYCKDPVFGGTIMGKGFDKKG